MLESSVQPFSGDKAEEDFDYIMCSHIVAVVEQGMAQNIPGFKEALYQLSDFRDKGPLDVPGRYMLFTIFRLAGERISKTEPTVADVRKLSAELYPAFKQLINPDIGTLEYTIRISLSLPAFNETYDADFIDICRSAIIAIMIKDIRDLDRVLPLLISWNSRKYGQNRATS